ncbi:MAG: LiaF transmembrane domain-containing protein [Saccharofermentanales bacterium]
MRRNISYILWGLLFIGAAVGLIGNIIGVWDFTVFFPGWWTIFLILPALIAMIQNGIRIPNSIVLCVGVLFLLESQEIIPDKLLYKLLGPAVLLLVGILIIAKAFIKNGDTVKISSVNTEDNPDYFALFSGTNIKNNSSNFSGGSATAIFGGNEINLSDVVLKGDCTFTVTSIFGANEIVAPLHAKVEMRGVPIFGGNENKAKSSDNPDSYKITFVCTSIFGGTEIK